MLVTSIFSFSNNVFFHGVVKSWFCVVELNTRMKRPFENIVAKGKNAGHQHFLLFHNNFKTYNRKLKFLYRQKNLPHKKNLDFSVFKVVFLDRSKFRKQFLKRIIPMEHLCEIISKSDHLFQRRFFQNFFMSV